MIVSGEMNIPDTSNSKFDIEKLARQVWDDVRYSHNGVLTVIDNVKAQSMEIRGKEGNSSSKKSSTGTFTMGDFHHPAVERG